jgi:hypothetical protein
MEWVSVQGGTDPHNLSLLLRLGQILMVGPKEKCMLETAREISESRWE